MNMPMFKRRLDWKLECSFHSCVRHMIIRKCSPICIKWVNDIFPTFFLPVVFLCLFSVPKCLASLLVLSQGLNKEREEENEEKTRCVTFDGWLVYANSGRIPTFPSREGKKQSNQHSSFVLSRRLDIAIFNSRMEYWSKEWHQICNNGIINPPLTGMLEVFWL